MFNCVTHSREYYASPKKHPQIKTWRKLSLGRDGRNAILSVTRGIRDPVHYFLNSRSGELVCELTDWLENEHLPIARVRQFPSTQSQSQSDVCESLGSYDICFDPFQTAWSENAAVDYYRVLKNSRQFRCSSVNYTYKIIIVLRVKNVDCIVMDILKYIFIYHLHKMKTPTCISKSTEFLSAENVVRLYAWQFCEWWILDQILWCIKG